MNTFNQPIAGAWDLTIPVRKQEYLAIGLAVINSLTNLISLIFIALIARDIHEPKFGMAMANLDAIAVAISLFTRIWSFRVSHLAAYRLENILRTALTAHLATVSLGYTQTLGAGTIKKIVQDDVRALHGFVADSVPLFGRAYTTPIATLPLLFIVDWRMALASIATLPIGLGAMSLAMKDYAQKREEYDRANENINSTVIEFVQGMQVVRTFDNGTSSFDRYQQSLDLFTQKLRDWTEATIASGRVGTLLFKSLPGLIIVLGVGIYLTIQGTLEIPILVLFLLLSANLNTSLEPIMLLNSFISEARASALRIGSIFAEPALAQPTDPQMPQDSSIAFKDVSFSYDPDRQILQNIDLDLAAGTVTAIVGLSGAGKTTLLRLIPRFWDVSSGSIEIGGVDLRQMTTDTLMSWISFVFQDTFLVNDSIRANICLGKPDATTAEIEAAAQSACAHDFILNLADGYNTIVGERGTRLSGGERQRITISRAILQNNPIVILDEATAFADPENELLIQQAIAALTQGKTLVVVAHRLATIQNADRIVVLDRGKVVEQGNHSELIASAGLYFRLWNTAQTARNWQLSARSRMLT
ncbi:MAG: ABC transporter ATP-binding protein [Chamaesiphon sp. CSU_1_12]|nr:ABC transporter ATP-binding protein [Chamaesiphon sp. CSU_1_12]